MLDWLRDLAVEFKGRLVAYEEERKMKYVTSIERRGIEKGKRIGSAELLLRQLRQCFGALEETV